MLILYVKTGCPYCEQVRRYAEGASILLHERDIADPAIDTELIHKGGMRQVPFLDDTDYRVQMYESDDIVEYLRQKYERGAIG